MAGAKRLSSGEDGASDDEAVLKIQMPLACVDRAIRREYNDMDSVQEGGGDGREGLGSREEHPA